MPSRQHLVTLFVVAALIPSMSQCQWALFHDADVLNYSDIVEQQGRMFISTSYDDVLISEDGGANWTTSGATDLPELIDLAGDGQYLFVVSCDEFKRSADNGATWQDVQAPWSDDMLNCEPRLFVFNGFLFASHSTPDFGGGLFRSSDHGTSWVACHTGIDDLDDIVTMAQAGGSLYAGAYGGLYGSSNNGTSWTMINPDEPVDLLFISGSRFIAAGWTVFDDQIIYSDDQGLSWQLATTEIELTGSRNDIMLTFDGDLWGNFRGRPYHSGDHGESWELYDDGLPGTYAVRTMHAKGDTLIAPNSYGIYFLRGDEVGITSHDPEPYKCWYAASEGRIQIEGCTDGIYYGANVTDLAGRSVLQNSFVGAGRTSFAFDAPVGLYHVQISSSNGQRHVIPVAVER